MPPSPKLQANYWKIDGKAYRTCDLRKIKTQPKSYFSRLRIGRVMADYPSPQPPSRLGFHSYSSGIVNLLELNIFTTTPTC